MKYYIAMAVLLLLIPVSLVMAQEKEFIGPGSFSVGTRNTFSIFDDDAGAGKGIGGQLRLQFSERLNSEWFFDYITSKQHDETVRNDYHVGWSLMYYPGQHIYFDKLLQPYIIAGHCFDYSKVSEQKNSSNFADRWSMAAQAGLGTHLNINRRFDCSLSAQYMLHFGKEIETTIDKEVIQIQKLNHSTPHGHMLLSVSFNYKLFSLWKGRG